MNKPTLAILGLGSRSTSFYFNKLNKLYLEQNGGFSTCPFILLNSDFNEINSLLPSPSEPLRDIIQLYVNKLNQFNTEQILIPNITLHETLDQLQLNEKLIHPLHLTVLELKRQNINQVTLFASLYSMQSSYISNYFESKGIKVLVPTEKDMVFIDDVRKKVFNGLESEDMINMFDSLIAKYSTNIPVVLACTELSILKPEHNNKVIDMARIQILNVVSHLPLVSSDSPKQ